jgi:pimeloyl-ACP methyl ester carboxylesterase
MNHREIEANGISLHFVEEGQGPAVIFCHGFPAIWSSWKTQMEAVASAGFMAVALDMCGYGGSSAPVEAEAYTPYQTVGDLVAILPSQPPNWLTTRRLPTLTGPNPALPIPSSTPKA